MLLIALFAFSAVAEISLLKIKGYNVEYEVKEMGSTLFSSWLVALLFYQTGTQSLKI
ncbi:hypothetical protein GCM10027180_27910 [Microbulbifer echini]